jgi:hypothetical protein
MKDLGYTHAEIMPITQYPFDGSWGYQATGFFSVDSRYGNPKQLMSFVDRMHQAGLALFLISPRSTLRPIATPSANSMALASMNTRSPPHHFSLGAAPSSISGRIRSVAS